MSMPPMGVTAGVMPIMGVWPIIGVAPPAMPTPAGVSSHRERPRFPAGVAPTAGVSPGAQPGVAPPSTWEQHRNLKLNCSVDVLGAKQFRTPVLEGSDKHKTRVTSTGRLFRYCRRTRPGVGVASSQRFRLGVASVPARPGVGVASHLLPCRPGVAPNSSGRAGVASHRPTAGVASSASHSEVFAFFLHPKTQLPG